MKKSTSAALALILFGGILTQTSSAMAGDEALRAETRKVVKEFAGELKATLQSAMKAGGPESAITVCNQAAPAIARGISEKYGWEIGRTSLRLRNPANAPDEWERKVLEDFERRKAAGEPVQKLEHAEVVQTDHGKVYRYMKAIPTGKVCLTCHGTNIQPALAKRIKTLYPEDKATGFRPGDIRGAFTVIRPMN
ncbi:MAG: DUF3365 domain-containing protein [Gammaproteobacteria bacterium]|nr:MAG: DUF3365 domain-containing protein [Gammaproteobacteria bacterium]